MTRALWTLVAGSVAVAGLAGCAASPRVELAAPKIMLHVEGKISSIEPVRGELKIQKIDVDFYRVSGTGDVRINEFHLVEVEATKARLHGVDVEACGSMRDVFVEKDKVIDGVHPDRVGK